MFQDMWSHLQVLEAHFHYTVAVQMINGSLCTSCGSCCHFPDYITNYVAPEPEGSSQHSRQPANGSYPELDESTPPPSQSP
jgi:hypothetical protein